jgi:hypothetical protein
MTNTKPPHSVVIAAQGIAQVERADIACGNSAKWFGIVRDLLGDRFNGKHPTA